MKVYLMFIGWKRNGRPFDHLLRHATNAFAFGCPDLIPFFDGPNVQIKTFPMEYYRNKSPADLDRWVLAQFEDMLESAKYDAALEERLRSPGNVFLLHLGGVDTSGHHHGALSGEYLETTWHLDTVIDRVEKRVSDFFGASDTLFIFTADHGFPNRGSHDLGGYETTHCPFITWGPSSLESVQDRAECSMEIMGRQVGIYASSLLGLSTAANNIVPFPFEAMNLNSPQMNKIALANYGQLVNEFCAQVSHQSSKSIIARPLLTRACSRQKRGLAKFEAEAANGSKSFAEIKIAIDGVIKARKLLFLMRLMTCSLSLMLVCLVLMLPVSISPKEHVPRLGRTLSHSILYSSTWCLIGYSSFFSFLASASMAIFYKCRNCIMGESLMKTTNLILTALMTAIAWNSKFWIIAVPFLVFPIFRESTALETGQLLVGLCSLFATSFNLSFFLRNLISVILIPIFTNRILRHFNEEESIFPAKSAAVLIGIILKLRLVMPAIPLHLRMMIMWLVTFIHVFFSIYYHKKGHKLQSLIFASIGAMALLFDPVLLLAMNMSIFLVLSRPKKAINAREGRSGSIITLFMALLLLAMGPLGVIGWLKKNSYWYSPLIEHLSPYLHYPLAAILSILTWSLVYKQEENQEEAEIEQLIDISIPTCGVVTLMIMFLQPKAASWLVIVSGLVKVLTIPALPLYLSAIRSIILMMPTLKYKSKYMEV